jgi:hypothetical protein
LEVQTRAGFEARPTWARVQNLRETTSKDTTQNFSLTKKNDDLFVQLFIRLRDETLSVIVGDIR